MEAIILAGGLGTRLRNAVSDLPKSMAPVNGRPFLYFLLSWLKNYPVDKIILSVGYRSDSVMDHFGDSFYDIPIDYAVEEKPLGTGGAVKFALKRAVGDNVLITNGDTYFPLDLGRFFGFHSDIKSRFSVALKRMKDFSRYGAVECTGNTITRFNEKKFCHDGLINGGIYLVNRHYFESLNLPEVFSLEKDFLEKEAGSSLIKGSVFDELFIDIGLPEDYFRASSVLPKELH